MVTFPPIINEKHLYFKQVPGGKVDEELHSQREIVRKFAQENNYPLLDLYKLILPNKEELISSDGIHLSAKGHTFFAQEMEKVLRKYKIVK
jgi:lysophospholipase L1-like esterase